MDRVGKNDMRVLLVGICGEYYHVGAFFRQALQALGCDYALVDEWKYVRSLATSFGQKAVYHLLGRPLTYWQFNRDLAKTARRFEPEVVLCVKGAYIAPHTLAQIKQHTQAILVNYATDDPFNPVTATGDLLAGIRYYDLYACTKRAIMNDVRRAGCAQVAFVPFGYEPGLHFIERPGTPEQEQQFGSDVVFIGGADADRLPIFEQIARASQTTVRLYGGFWDRHDGTRHFYRGMALGRDYRLALGGAKIALGLVRRANRDGHAMRTFEIPACGAFMLAERTDEHLEFFEEDKEAGYFGSNEELLEKTQYYLKHDAERQRMAEAAQTRLRQGHHTYRDRLLTILEAASSLR
jgi:spore maturation protein CgeB